MKWATFPDPKSGRGRVAPVQATQLHALREGLALLDLLGDDGERLADAGRRVLDDPDEVFALDDVELRAPVPRPPSMRGNG